jgi:hypothetical protein
VSRDEEAYWGEIFASHPIASRITEEAIADALKGFSLKPVRELHWLARAIQPAVYLAATQPRPAKKNAEVRSELGKLAAQARVVCFGLFNLSNEGEEAVWRCASALPGATSESANADLACIDDVAERLLQAVLILERAAGSDQAWQSQSQKVLQASERDLHKWFAVWLSPAFEEGFGCAPVLKNEDRTSPSEHGPWADFYQRVTGLAFARPAVNNLRKVLKEARAVTKGGRALEVVRFPPGWFPK